MRLPTRGLVAMLGRLGNEERLAMTVRRTGLIGMAAALLLAGGVGQAKKPDFSLEDMFGPHKTEAELRDALKEADKFPLGSEQNPIRADMPAGQRAYLSRLRCSDGKAPQFERGGSVGSGPYGSIVDVYGVHCGGGATPAESSIYIDMYHSHVESRAVAGFTIIAP